MSESLSAQDKAMHGKATSLYVHVPFCARTCDYCAFYQDAPTAESIQGYLAGIRKEWALTAAPSEINTVFWGGGTPGLLSAKDLGTLAALFPGPKPLEWTVEMTPLSATEARLCALREAGVTRISLGVQSFRQEALKALGRDHTVAQAYKAIRQVRAAGFQSLNIDLMFALPGQDDEAWNEDLRCALGEAPDHISTYCLTFEEDTRLWLKLSEGKVKRDIEAEARLYEGTWETLESAGYHQYEISNFARPGHACLHNLNTWRMGEWLGLGPSAASQFGGFRSSNVANLEEWLAQLAEGRRSTEARQALSPELLAEDALIFGLRMNDGVDLACIKSTAPGAPWGLAEALVERLHSEGLLLRKAGRISLTRRGRMVADAVGAEFVGLFSGETS